MKGSIWLVQAGERLPIDGDPRIMRMGMVAEELYARGHEIHWFTARFDHAKKVQRDGSSFQEYRPGYFIHLLDGCSYAKNISVFRILHQLSVARAFRSATKLLSTPALILSAHPTPDLSSTAALVAKDLGVKFILDIRDPWPDMFPGYFSPLKQKLIAPILRYYRSLLRIAAKEASAIFAVSDAMLQWGLGYAGRRAQKSDKVIHIGYDGGTSSSQLPIETQRVTGPLECVFVSTFGQSYDADTVIDAFRLLNQNNIGGIHCTFVGDGERRGEVEQRAQGLNNVRFTGWLGHSELSSLLQSSDVGIIAIRGGITDFMLPNKLFEYLSYGLAIVNTLPFEAAHILSRAQAGETVTAGNAQAMADVLTRWAADPRLVRKLRENAHRTFVENFQAEQIYRIYADEVERIIEEQSDDETKYLQVRQS